MMMDGDIDVVGGILGKRHGKMRMGIDVGDISHGVMQKFSSIFGDKG
jgi:hypothetical protein